MTLPNILTTIRMLFPLIIIFILFLNFNSFYENLLILICFILLSFTDFLDGYLARKLKVESKFGKIFDPISDKVLTCSSLLYITSYNSTVLIPSLLIIAREFIVSGNREYMLTTKGKTINVIFISKLKTTFQFISITMLLSSEILLGYINIINIAIGCIWITTILTLYTGIKYSYNTYSSKKRK